jgi:low temperature requirement protein LtrA
VLVLTAGVSDAFEDGDFGLITLGYVVMRLAMVAQWLRAAAGDPAHRRNAVRYAAGISVVQVFWVLRLALPEPFGGWAFLVLVVAELAVPVWAERGEQTPWHPRHIVERYGLFTIIVLGECVFAATAAVRIASSEAGWSRALVLLFAAAVTILFTLWWLYFAAADAVEVQPSRSFLWGYGHYFLFASVAALGAGLEASVAGLERHAEAPATTPALAVAVPVSAFIVLVWVLHTPLGMPRAWGVWVPPTVVAVLCLAWFPARAGANLGLVAALVAVPPVVLLTGLLVDGARHREVVT